MSINPSKQFCLLLILTLAFSNSNLLVSQNIRESETKLNQKIKQRDSIYTSKQLIVLNHTKDTLEISDIVKGVVHGTKREYFKNRQLSYIANYKKGLVYGKVVHYHLGKDFPRKIEHYKILGKENKSVLHGIYKTFSVEGKLNEEYNFKNGEKDGGYILYHYNSKIKEKGTYTKGLLSGQVLKYNFSGQLISDNKYKVINNPDYKSKNESNLPAKISLLHGIQRTYSNGEIHTEHSFKLGKKDGICKDYFQNNNGKLRSEIEYKDDKPHGTMVYYHSNGKVEKTGKYYSEIKYKDSLYKNVYDGEFITYQENGMKQSEVQWKNYRLNGYSIQYHRGTEVISQKTLYINSLKSGLEEYFDVKGNKNKEIYYEIAEEDGKLVSRKTLTETSWQNGVITLSVEWKNGKRNGYVKDFYPNGTMSSIRFFVDDELEGISQTFYENGQLKDSYTYRKKDSKYSSNSYISWNVSFDENGKVKRRTFYSESSKKLIEQDFVDGIQTQVQIESLLKFNFSKESTPLSLIWNGVICFEFFSNQKLRQVQFRTNENYWTKVNFTTKGDINQIQNEYDKYLNDTSSYAIASHVIEQYNPEWHNLPVISNTDSNGNSKYQWNYRNGQPFFKIEFKDSLPHGKWIVFNPLYADTLYASEFSKGQLVNHYVIKNIQGTVIKRMEYHSNHTIKERLTFYIDGVLNEHIKVDSEGKTYYNLENYKNGRLKLYNNKLTQEYHSLRENGDTASSNFLITDKEDTFKIEKQFFDNNMLKSLKIVNVRTQYGTVNTFYENGQLNFDYELLNQNKNGDLKRFDKEGRLLAFGKHVNNKKEGNWFEYTYQNGDTISKILYFENDRIVPSKSSSQRKYCECLDTSMHSSKVGFANMLSAFGEYKDIHKFIPKNIIPEVDFDNIFALYYHSSANRGNGYYSFKLLPFRRLSFYYPSSDNLKFDLIPCSTPGYLDNISMNVSYNYSGIRNEFQAEFETKRISISLMNNPLKNIEDTGAYTAYFDTKRMNIDTDGIKKVEFVNQQNNCFPPGIIGNLLKVQILDAEALLNPPLFIPKDTIKIPMLEEELNSFYGFLISEARIEFNYKVNDSATLIKAKSDLMMTGANFVSGRFLIEGEILNNNEFRYNNNMTIKISEMKSFLEQSGFYRVGINAHNNKLEVQFFIDK